VKKPYHHGELRQALIDAARALVREKGSDGFSLSDACRKAGVSTAAPYRHFADKHEILDEVVAQGFADLTLGMQAAATVLPAGASARILGMGHAYLSFAIAEPALFRMMFGQKPDAEPDHLVVVRGKDCFGFVVQEVMSYCAANHVEGDAMLIALQLWTLVHGATSLTIDGDYAKISDQIEVGQILSDASDRLLFSLARRGEQGDQAKGKDHVE
jgi:AcrR family transcriptional regulator